MSSFEIKGGKPTITKDPNAKLDYTFDWSAYLSPVGDAVAIAEFFVEGVVIASQSVTPTTAVVWLTGGTLNSTHKVTCRITTDGGRKDDRTIYISIKEQ